MSTVYLVSEVRSPLVDFGLAEIRQALQTAGHDVVGPSPVLRNDPRLTPVIVVRAAGSYDQVDAFIAGADGRPGPTYPDESFTIAGDGSRIVIEAAHPRGLLYGCLEVADLVRAEIWVDDGLEVTKSPSLAVRGVSAGYGSPPAARRASSSPSCASRHLPRAVACTGRRSPTCDLSVSRLLPVSLTR